MRDIILVLHNIRSLYNVGSIFRTADASRVKKIYLVGITPLPTDQWGNPRPQLIKVSLGAEKTVPWDGTIRSAYKILALIKKLKEEKYKIFAVEQAKKSVPYYSSKFSKHKKIVLMFGNEVQGLPSSILNVADAILEIPMRSAMVRQAHHPRKSKQGKESLNVSVAAGIVLFRILYS